MLTKLKLCRTEKLRDRLYECPSCQRLSRVFNSCGDRNCPQCSGARRANWLEKTRGLLLKDVNYFQVVFTIPDFLSWLILGNRREMYALLFRSAWRSLRDELLKQNIEPAGLLVLHTWNQQLQHHPHIHALVPGAGPSANKDADPCWVTAKDPNNPRRRKPFLVNNVELGQTFRDKFARGLGALLRKQRLKLTDEWQLLADPKVRRSWLKSLRTSNWNVFIAGPPHGKSDPQQLMKYLARYMTGGPISDSRIVSDENGMVTFLARSKEKGVGQEKVKLPGAEFVRRWSLHILPKGFTRSRCFGGYHGRNRKSYLETCRQLLSQPESQPLPAEKPADNSVENATEKPQRQAPLCPHCQVEMNCIASEPRPSWNRLLYKGQELPPEEPSATSGGVSPNQPAFSTSQLPKPDD